MNVRQDWYVAYFSWDAGGENDATYGTLVTTEWDQFGPEDVVEGSPVPEIAASTVRGALAILRAEQLNRIAAAEIQLAYEKARLREIDHDLLPNLECESKLLDDLAVERDPNVADADADADVRHLGR